MGGSKRIDAFISLGVVVTLTRVFSVDSAVPPGYRGTPFNDAEYRAEQRAAEDRPALPYHAYTEGLSVWNGKTAARGLGWVNGGESESYARLDDPDADGRRVIHFHTTLRNYRSVALGWEWTPSGEKGIDLGPYAAVSFSLKVTGPKKMRELFFGLTNEEPAPIAIRPFEPGFADGGWHRITIPVQAMKWNSATASSEIRGIVIKTFVWDASDFDLFLDQVSLDRQATPGASPDPQSVVMEANNDHGLSIPGKLECAFYDRGGEGVAYHDTTPINILSAVLNQQSIHQRPHATAYHWNFRRNEGVDTSYVKDFADLNHPNLSDPVANQLYIGGAEDGEWCNYTIHVRKAGAFKIIAKYGNIAGVKPLRFSLDGKPAAVCPCPVVTGSMHKWAQEEVGRIAFPEVGAHLLTLHYERGYNLAYFEFLEVRE